MAFLPAHSRALAERDAARRDAIRARGLADQEAARRKAADVDAMHLGAELGRVMEELRATRAQLAAAELRHRGDRVVDELLKDRLLVFMKGGGVFDGLLLDADDRTMTFGDVHRRGADGTNTTSAPGELYIERTSVHYMQRVAADQAL